MPRGRAAVRERQIVNLAVARHWQARYPWFAQVRRSLAAGIPQTAIDAINAGATPDLSDPRQHTCFVVTRDLLANGALSDAANDAAKRTLGENDLIALVAQIGNFSMTCLSANAFGLTPPADDPAPLRA